MNKFQNKLNIYSHLRDEDDPISWNPIDSLPPKEANSLEVSIYELGGIFRSATHICEEYGVPESIRTENCPVLGMEVGDDRVDLCRDPFRLALGLICQEQVLHMQTSWEDTCISNSVWNFCEITSGIPADIVETFDYCRKNNGFEDLGFVDCPPLRIILDVSKGDGSHSSTSSGKAAMLGTRMRTPRASILRVLHLASFIQDGMLRTSMSSDPKYLPRIMGGSGVRPLFDNPENLYLYTLAYKGGRCNRIYGSATRELQECLRHLNEGKATMPVLCKMLSDKQEYLHGTYSNMIFAPTFAFKDEGMETLPHPLIESTGGANRFNATLNRLVRTKHLVTRSVALREWQFTKTIRARLLSKISTSRLESEANGRKTELRKKFGFALSANTAFANLLARRANWQDVESLLRSDKHYTITTGSKEFTYYDAQWIASGAKYEDFDIEDLTITEDLHAREDVSEEQTFKVGGLTLRPIVGNRITNQRTTTRVGLYEINKSMEDWAENLYGRILEHREEGKSIPRDVLLTEINKDPEWVNDDTALIEQCLHDTQSLHQRSARVVLVSADKRLANQMSNTCNVQVERLSPITYIMYAIEQGLDPIHDREQVSSLVKGKIPKRERSDPVRQVYVDTGSLAHYLSNMEEVCDASGREIFRREVIDKGSYNGTRWSKYVMRPMSQYELSFKTIPVRPVLRDKRFPHRQSGRSSYTTSRSLGTQGSGSIA